MNDKIYLIIISGMKNSWIIFGILIFIFSIFIIYSYDIYEDDGQYHTHNKPSIQSIHRNDRVRCPPKIYKQVQTENKNKFSINLYNGDNKINNKGFINELMYKPKFDYNTISYSNGVSVPSIELNDYSEKCNEPLFGNVHRCWLLNK